MAPKIYLPTIKKDDSPKNLMYREDLYRLIFEDSLQQRDFMLEHVLLEMSAQIRADDMAEREYFSHTSPDGTTVNEVIRSTGYILPSYYPLKGNSCESIHMGNGSAKEVLEGWTNSFSHSNHIFGKIDFFRNQKCVGIGIAKSKLGRFYTVFISAQCYE